MLRGVRLDGAFYSISFGAVRPDVVTDHVITRGTYDGAPTELRRIAGVDPQVLVAIRLDGGERGDEDEPVSAWSMVFPGDGATRSDREAAICAAGFEQDRCPPS